MISTFTPHTRTAGAAPLAAHRVPAGAAPAAGRVALARLAPLALVLALGVVLPVALGGCAALDGPAASDTGRPFDDAYVAQIRKGITTKADIRQNIGEPWQTTTTAGNDSWTYHYSDAYANALKRSQSFGLYRKEPINRMLVITFTGDKVLDFSYTK